MSEIVHLHEYKGGGFVFSIIEVGKSSVFWRAVCCCVCVWEVYMFIL